jgi:hypothetical protein
MATKPAKLHTSITLTTHHALAHSQTTALLSAWRRAAPRHQIITLRAKLKVTLLRLTLTKKLATWEKATRVNQQTHIHSCLRNINKRHAHKWTTRAHPPTHHDPQHKGSPIISPLPQTHQIHHHTTQYSYNLKPLKGKHS